MKSARADILARRYANWLMPVENCVVYADAVVFYAPEKFASEMATALGESVLEFGTADGGVCFICKPGAEDVWPQFARDDQSGQTLAEFTSKVARNMEME